MKRVIACVVAVVGATAAVADTPTGTISIDPSQLGAAHPRAAAAATRVAARTPRMPAVLAAAGEPAKRAELEQSYTQLLAAFEQTVDKAKLSRNDVAVAAAIFVSGAYGAYRGTQITDAAFSSMVTQLRDLLAATASFTRAAMDTKQDMYEGLAITGTLLAASAQTKPGTGSVRAAAKTYLESFLHTSADSIQITDRGITIAGATAPAAAPTPAVQDPGPAAKPYPASKIQALLWSWQIRYEAYPANSMVTSESSYTLFTDGTCLSGTPKTLDGYDPAAERAKNPKSKCKWHKDGASYTVSTGGPFNALPNLTVLLPAKRGERLAGAWTRNKTGTVGTTSTWRGTTLVLGGDGRFSFSAAGAFQSGSEVNRQPGEVTISGSYDGRGSRTNTSGDHGGVSTKTSTGRGAADEQGTYALDGYTIELHYDSGTVERHLFAASSDPNHVFVRLDGTTMSKKSK